MIKFIENIGLDSVSIARNYTKRYTHHDGLKQLLYSVESNPKIK